jgi:hypothetical protein
MELVQTTVVSSDRKVVLTPAPLSAFQQVTQDQFKISSNELVHVPTGARFTRFPGERVMRHVFWNSAGLCTEFQKLDIFNAATALIASGIMDETGNGMLASELPPRLSKPIPEDARPPSGPIAPKFRDAS